MPRKPKPYTDCPPEVVHLIAALATTTGRDDEVRSAWGSKADAYSFRQKLYAWRRAVLVAVCNPDALTANPTKDYLRHTFGPRVNKEWLDYTVFGVASGPEGGHPRYRVTARVRHPMAGPDIRFADGEAQRADLADSARMIAEARARSAQGAHGQPLPPLDDAP